MSKLTIQIEVEKIGNGWSAEATIPKGGLPKGGLLFTGILAACRDYDCPEYALRSLLEDLLRDEHMQKLTQLVCPGCSIHSDQ
jgi:hypothetical protein